MKDMFSNSAPIKETRSSVGILEKKGKTWGNNIFIALFKMAVLYILSAIFMSLCILGVVAIEGVISKGTDQGLASGVTSITTAEILGMLYAEIFIIVIYVLFAKIFEKRSLLSLGFSRDRICSCYLKGILGAFLCMGAASLICICTGAMTLNFSSFSLPILIVFAFGWMLQGLAEEVMCRGYLMTILSKKYSVLFGIIVNSIVFAALHAGNPTDIAVISYINLFLYGVFSSLLFLYSENIWLCAGFHSAWNMIQGNVLGIPVSGINVTSFFVATFDEGKAAINGGTFGLEGGLGVTFVMLLGCAIIIVLMKKKKQSCINQLSGE